MVGVGTHLGVGIELSACGPRFGGGRELGRVAGGFTGGNLGVRNGGGGIDSGARLIAAVASLIAQVNKRD